MSTANYSRFVNMGLRMLNKYGEPGVLRIISAGEQLNAWDQPKPVNNDLIIQVAKFDAIKTLDKQGNPLKCDATFYASMQGLSGVTDIPYMTPLWTNSEPTRKWSVVKAELIKPAEVGCLWIIWVQKYASINA